MLKKIIFSFLILIFSIFININVFSDSVIPIENVFLDINKDYPYYNELQTLFDKGIIEPEIDNKFHYQKLLERDEFVGIAMETSCNRCIVPHEELFLHKYNDKKPFFDVGLDNKYYYCIADAASTKYVVGYRENDKCNDGTWKSGEIPFCISNNIKLEEALAVIMRMGGILTHIQAESEIKKIKNGQIYKSLANDLNPTNIDGTPYSFYPYFKKALEYEIIDYDNFGNKKVYKLIEKKGDYLRPNTLITKQDFLIMAFIALKANSCNDIIDNRLALRMDIYDDLCDETKLINNQCSLSNLEDIDNTFDFDGVVKGVCEKGIDEINGYLWRFVNIDTGEQILKYGKFINDYKFLKAGKYKVFLRVTDKCGQTAEVWNTLNIPGKINGQIDKELDLRVSIRANPIIGYGPLEVDLTGIPIGGKSPYKFYWDFGDGNTGRGETIKHIFIEEGVYNVTLTLIDSDGIKVDATVLIKVLENKCENDSDGDGLNDCIDKCPIVKGVEKNKGCPIFIDKDISFSLSKCIENQNNSGFIFGNIICNSCPCSKSIDFRAILRKCDIIIPAITSPTQRDIYSRGTKFQIKR